MMATGIVSANRIFHLLVALLFAPMSAVYAEAPFVRDGKAGFVVSDFAYALSGDAGETGACPSGTSRNLEEIFAMTPQGKRRKGESDEDYAARLREGARALATAPNGQNVCMHPEVFEPDPHYRTVQASDVPVDGIDIDGENARNDFPGMNGGEGIDNQFFRIVGCNRGYQPSGQANSFAIEMLTGSWGILVTLSGVDDIRNDDHVEVGIHANADPIQLSPTREPLAYATYAMDQDPRFRATTVGRIENGVLTTEPADVRFRHVVNSMRLERVLHDARLQATLSEDGVLEGYLAGYTPVEVMYDFQFGYRNGRDGSGNLAGPLRQHSANGAALVLGHTCHGVYHALYEHADGHPDPETGQFTSISTQYRLQAIPAFVVDVDTESANAGLDQKAEYSNDY